MAITATAYGNFLAALGQASIDLTSDNIWVALFTSSYTPDYDNDSGYFDVRNSGELPDGGDGSQLDSATFYTRNGQQLKNTSWSYEPTNKAAVLRADNVAWTTLTGTFRYAVVYKWVPLSIDTVMIGTLDYGTDQTVTGAAFSIDFSSGVIAVAR